MGVPTVTKKTIGELAGPAFYSIGEESFLRENLSLGIENPRGNFEALGIVVNPTRINNKSDKRNKNKSDKLVCVRTNAMQIGNLEGDVIVTCLGSVLIQKRIVAVALRDENLVRGCKSSSEKARTIRCFRER